MYRKPEILAPAGNFEKLEIAIAYGADAVYLGGDSFGLRAMAGNFTSFELKKAVEYAHNHGVKIYVTLNIFPHNLQLVELPEYIRLLQSLRVDAFIISDPGVFAMARQIAPDVDVHISTQANTLNWASAKFWHNQGASRVILARELSFHEISEIKDKSGIELEAFVHGAMCISYSGRCYLSHYLTNRDANLGACTQPCRWSYAIVEEQRPGQFFPIESDDHGTYIMNSKDLCMLEHIPQLVETGLTSFKIEGRMKSIHYVATVTKAYREAVDQYSADPDHYSFKSDWLEEIYKVSNREFTTGFYLGNPDGVSDTLSNSGYTRNYDFVGLVQEYDPIQKVAIIEQRNHVTQGDYVEVLTPGTDIFEIELEDMRTTEGIPIDSAPHPQMMYTIRSEKALQKFDLLRRKKQDMNNTTI